MILSSDKY